MSGKSANPPNDAEFETRQNIFQIYLASYKKFKYWFAVFYFLSFIFYLLVYNQQISDKLEIYRDMQNLINLKEQLQFISGPNQIINIENINTNIKNKLSYKPIIDADWSKGKLQQSTRQYPKIKMYADSLDIYTDFKFSNSINQLIMLLPKDSVMIEDTITYYDYLINQDSILSKKDDLKYKDRAKVRSMFIKSFNQMRFNYDLANFPFDEISIFLFNKYSLIDSTYADRTMQEQIGFAQQVVNDVENWLKEQLIDPQNFKVPLTFGDVKEFVMHMMVLIALSLQFHFLNYKFYEKNFFNNQQALTRVPAINNIFENLHLPLLSNQYIMRFFIFFSYSINLILPIIVMYLIGIKVWKVIDYHVWFGFAIIIYLIGFISIILHLWRRNIRLLNQMKYHFLFIFNSISAFLIKNFPKLFK